MKRNIQELLIPVIQESLKEIKLDIILTDEIYLDFPTDRRFGDLSTNIAMVLSRRLKRAPLETAELLIQEIRKKIKDQKISSYIAEIKAEGAGFINFYLKENYFYESAQAVLIQGKKFFKSNQGKNRKVLIEFVSANPTGPLSVAHARQAVVGDCLANIFSFLGFKVKKEYYLNDEGNQINILGESLKLRLRQLEGENIDFPENYYQGEYIFQIAKEIKNKGLRINDFAEFASNHILDIIKKELDDFGVKFDYWYSQKGLRKKGKIEKTLKLLKDKGVLYENEGALWFKSSEFGDDKDRVVVKSDGSYTYLAPDMAYHLEKYKRGFNWLINLWGPDHHGYINRLKASVEALGFKKETLCIIIVQLATIFRGGKPLQMSTRKGQYITLRQILEEVSKDASRFFFLMRRTSSHLDFDIEIAKKHTAENPVYYVQYAHARICSILENVDSNIRPKRADFGLLKEKEELDLIKKITKFSSVLEICLGTRDPYMLTVYLQEVAESFHKFYDLHRVLGTDQALSRSRVCLIECIKVVLALGLELLGISRPQKM